MRLPVVILPLVGACLLARPACADPAVKRPDTYIYVDNVEIEGLDPAWNLAEDSQGVILNLYDSLFEFAGPDPNQLVPVAAKELPTRDNGGISKDGLTVTIRVRNGIRFHDGTLLTADDVGYSLLRTLFLKPGADFLWRPLTGKDGPRDASGVLRETAYQEAASAVETRADAIVFHLARPFPRLPQTLARWLPILSKRWAVAHGEWDGKAGGWRSAAESKKEQSAFLRAEQGSGPFALSRWDRESNALVLSRNPDYWRGPAKLQRVVIRYSPEAHLRRLMLEAGDADAIAFDRSLLPQIEGLPGVEIVDDLPNLLVLSTYLQFCVQADPKANPYLGSGQLDGGGIPPDFFSDADLRKAFAYSFNYAEFIKAVLKGHGARRSSVFPDAMAADGPRRPAYDYDPASARAHFERARGGEVWKQGFRLSLVMPKGNAVFESAAQMLKGSVESLNPKFQIDLQALDLSIFSGVSGVKAPLVLTGSYVEVADPDAFAMRFLKSNPQRPCVYAGDEIDRLIDEAASATSSEEKSRLYGELIDQANAEVPLVPIASSSRFRVQRSWVKGWKYNPLMPLKPELFYTVYKSEAPSSTGRSEPSSRP